MDIMLNHTLIKKKLFIFFKPNTTTLEIKTYFNLEKEIESTHRAANNDGRFGTKIGQV